MVRGYKKIIIVLCTLLLIAGTTVFADVRKLYKSQNAYSDKLIRFHVIANSDSPEDQELKLKVRDKIISEMNEKFVDISSIEETKQLVKNSLDEIKYIAEREVRERNKNYDVNVYFGNSSFPTKSYGGFTLPAGEYEAVKVVLGEGKGKNWWCVMFPPLCFIDVTHGLTDSKTKAELKKVLTEEEFKMISSTKDGERVPIKLKFKIVEIIKESKTRFAELFISEE